MFYEIDLKHLFLYHINRAKGLMPFWPFPTKPSARRARDCNRALQTESWRNNQTSARSG